MRSRNHKGATEMVDKISYIPQQPIAPIKDPNQISGRKTSVPSGKPDNSVSFDSLLKEQLVAKKAVTFSGHAQQRLKARNISFSSQQLDRITDAIDRAAVKGARDSLLLVDNVAAVVSVENRTVVTVVDGASMKDNVFTNIDSAVIA